MDNLQFWLYIAFAVIYFITRSLKKPQQPVERPGRNTSSENQDMPPVSFEELLEEITGKRTLKPTPTTSKKEVDEVQEFGVPRHSQNVAQFKDEGINRQFSDEESRRVYEESIRIASQFSQREAETEISRKKKVAQIKSNKSQSSVVAADLKTMLQDQDGAKRAIILAEILNRKY